MLSSIQLNMSRLTSILTRSLVPRYFSAVQANSKYFSTTSATLNNNRPVSYNLDNKVAMVTASTDGIGLAIAKRLAQSGASVVISSRKQSNVDKAVADLKGEGLNVEGLVCHVGKDSDRKALVQFTLEKFGGIDIFVSNAAVNPAVGPILDTKEGAWDKIFEINVKAALLLTQDVVPHMEKRKGGSITYISSIGGYQILPDISAYSVSKTALLGLTKAVAIQVAPLNIRANVVCPGIIKTRFSEAIRSDENFLDSGFGRDLLIKRVGEPDEIAGVVAFLSSEDASYITGESVVPAGGYYSRL